ncbi:chromosome segregation protein SMC [Sulfitobacter sp. F26169L]|uniref:AAA family ATPase n=1 Tax=Sulfitobacter sp. F26169L TaxID=2996015 RepID=UPI002260B7BA|nr:chromosome segregation protein SMC [Sulfitobacter sp. F26169L]MCX7564977.1 chromosome segregation protein SMC [Sulfitobacter sp. F26169L]
MKLRSLTLGNVRKFAGQTATISGIGDGVTVVSEANEFGKSTFFDALHALFFLKYGAATREVKSLQPRAGGPVRVSAQIELPSGNFTIEKTFLAQKRAAVRDAAGELVALDDEAESWIARLMGSGLDGPAGLLWVRQGITALEPAGNAGADKTEKERLLGARRNLLSSVAGEIDMVTGGRRMDRVIEAATQALGKLATATGQPKANGPWKEAEQEAQTHAQRHDELDARCRELSQALERRREVAARLKVLEQPALQTARNAALEKAQAAYSTALAHADKLAQAKGQADLRELELEGAQTRLDGLIAAADQYTAACAQFELDNAALEKAIAEVKAAEESTEQAQTALTQASAKLRDAVQAKEAAQQDALRQNAAEQYARLQKQLAQVGEKRSALEDANAALATMPVTAAALASIEQKHTALTAAQAEIATGGVQMHLSYDGDAVVSSSEGPLTAGTHHLARRQTFDLPGIGRMTLDPGAAAADMAAVSAAQAQLKDALDAVGVADIAAARQAASARKEKADEVFLLRNMLEMLAPEGVERMQAECAKAKATLDALSKPVQAAPVDPAELAAQADAARLAEEQTRDRFERARDARDAARTMAARLQVLRDAAQTAMDTAARVFGDPDTFEERKTQAARAHSLAQLAAQDARAAAAALAAKAPDLATAKADLNRATSAVENAREETAQLRTQSADLSATIRARAEDGVEEKRDEAEGLMIRAQERAARFAHEVAGLTLLVEALRAKRGAAQEAYFGPVQQELAPLLALLHADAALSFDPASLLPQAIARGGTDEPMEMLSGGTQEQIAILTRLAFARLFARQGKPMPVILDDALVYSDDSRITAMFTALHRVADNQQVIVFSCRQMAFAGLGGTRPNVEIKQDH